MKKRVLPVWLFCVWLVLMMPVPSASALDASGVLVLYNSADADSQAIASYYAQKHPGVSLLGLENVPDGEVISAGDYLDVLRPQILPAMHGGVDCLVTTKGLPLRIDNASQSNRYSSLESELARIDTIDSIPLMGNQKYYLPEPWGGNPLALNPYFQPLGSDPAGFDHAVYGTRLTARLDGFSVNDIRESLDHAQQAFFGRPGGMLLLDDAPEISYDLMPRLHDEVLDPMNVPHVMDNTDGFVQDVNGRVTGYISHGVHGGACRDYLHNPENGIRFSVAPGAIFHTWESYNAYTFDKDTADALPAYRKHGLIAEWLDYGGTAGVGVVEEPTAGCFTVLNEDRFWEMMLSGMSFAESAWAATMQLSFVNTVVGDPLMSFKPWQPGDTNFDGIVNGEDLAIIAMYYNRPGSWENGDLDGNSRIDSVDLAIVGLNYGKTANPVPEPSSLALLAGTAGLYFRRRSR